MHNSFDKIIKSDKLFEGESEPRDDKYIEKFQELLRDEPEPSSELLTSLDGQERGTLLHLRGIFTDIEETGPESNKYKTVLNKINSLLDE